MRKVKGKHFRELFNFVLYSVPPEKMAAFVRIYMQLEIPPYIFPILKQKRRNLLSLLCTKPSSLKKLPVKKALELIGVNKKTGYYILKIYSHERMGYKAREVFKKWLQEIKTDRSF